MNHKKLSRNTVCMFLKDLINIPGMEKLDQELLFSEVFKESLSVLFKENKVLLIAFLSYY